MNHTLLPGLLLAISTVAAASDARVLTWAIRDWPPVFIVPTQTAPKSVTQLGNGVADQNMAALIAHMPEYEHRFVYANINRIFADMAAGTPECFAVALKTPEREKAAWFTRNFLLPPMHMVVRKDQLARITAGSNGMAVEALSKRSDLAAYVENGRSYGAAVDSLVKTAPGVFRSMTVTESGQLIRMLDAGRMDYTFEYPYVVEYMQRQFPFRNELALLPIAEAATPLTSYVACTRNAWGLQAIRDIDRAIRMLARTQAFRQPLYDWLSPELRDRYRPQIERFYDERARRPDLPANP
ncbi:hypothetical protein IGB42_01723 [Andreprevotia sp. IGB-42]|uniref:TIGR02285 family protein n=1 Tax=Andreprevotia sp. IGB-42 TaxID=2497473 RepID=UPI001359C0DE|nr:TIGR02285 family protein [Andreprevotia sp. IGB-42]KAF0814043.1 hypothetical protein IGB42_01723 [Andreprevotia sp. IGB-42]